MNGYLSNLIARTVEQPPSIRPRLVSLFEPTSEPTIRIAAESLRAERNIRPRSVSTRHEDHASPTRQAEADAKLSPIHRFAENLAEPPKQAAEHGDQTMVARPPKLQPESSPPSLIPHPTVSSRIDSIIERASPVPPSRDNEAQPGHIQERTESQARREEARSSVESTAATVIETPVPSLAEPEVVIQEVDKSLRHDAPRVRSMVVRPQVNLSSEPPAIPQETPSSIRITIGRVDVRAIMPQAATAPRVASTKASAGPSLDEYLKQRNGAKL